MNRRESHRRMLALQDAWAARLGIDSTDSIGDELAERFAHLSQYVLAGPVDQAGRGIGRGRHRVWRTVGAGRIPGRRTPPPD